MRRKILAKIQYLEQRVAQEPHHPPKPHVPHPPTHHAPPPRHVGTTSSGKKIEFHHDHPSHSNFSEMDHLEAHGKHKSRYQHHKSEALRWRNSGHPQKAAQHDSAAQHHYNQSMHHYNSAVQKRPKHLKPLPKPQF